MQPIFTKYAFKLYGINLWLSAWDPRSVSNPTKTLHSSAFTLNATIKLKKNNFFLICKNVYIAYKYGLVYAVLGVK